MTLKKYLNLMSVLSIFCWLFWVFVIFFINPEETGLIGFVLFYFSLFLAILGTIAIIGFLIRARFIKGPVFKHVEASFRQGIWLSLLIVGLFLLQGLGILRWWNALFLLLFLMFLEFFFLSSRKKYKT
ncbi:hypothetical protein KKG58_03665 [Patescibacteria group bacterium]|nr:hypothetical protein [Patescibacteria group bacterium]